MSMKNCLGIKSDPALLRIVERELTSSRAETVEKITGHFDGQHLRAIHKHLFQDVF
ncbi:hypothetical protein [Cochlodiniinecator piscidefendens]|uniref:hypothetical protein n=1 Tax=Cochlodiniinecator piscidefendens TaxID=2715756 RepID=UPI001408B98C|nr:hypothetical protein [Cochlodiniinecator piscidefendens]